MDSALQQALKSMKQLEQSLNAQISAGGKNLLGYKINQAGRQLGNFIKNFTDNPVPQDRKGKKAEPIGSTEYGGILYSDGSVKMPGYVPTSPQEQTELNILRENLLAQIPYTPEAQKQIREMDMYAMGDRGDISSFNNLAGGFAMPGEVQINRNMLYGNGQDPRWGVTGGADALSHEILHYLDDNMYQQTYKDSVANSLGFDDVLKRVAPKVRSSIYNGPLNEKNLYDRNNQQTRDMEGYAYFGSQGPDAYLRVRNPEVQARYANVYHPMSKAQNMSYKYPTQQTYGRLTSRFQKSNQLLPGNSIEEDL